MSEQPTFEETYPKYEFSRLVHLGLLAGGWILRMLRRAKAARSVGRRGAGHIRHAD
jgi:hypothetical protein